MARKPSQRSLFADAARQRLAYQATQFEKIFGVRLGKFWLGPTLRLNVTLLDQEVIKSGDAPMADVVAQRYGNEAVELISALL